MFHRQPVFATSTTTLKDWAHHNWKGSIIWCSSAWMSSTAMTHFVGPKAILGQNQRAQEIINEGPFSIKQRMACQRFEFVEGKNRTNYFYFMFAKIESGKSKFLFIMIYFNHINCKGTSHEVMIKHAEILNESYRAMMSVMGQFRNFNDRVACYAKMVKIYGGFLFQVSWI